MKSLFYKSFLSLTATVLFLGCASLRTSKNPASKSIQATIDLVEIKDDKASLMMTFDDSLSMVNAMKK